MNCLRILIARAVMAAVVTSFLASTARADLVFTNSLATVTVSEQVSPSPVTDTHRTYVFSVTPASGMQIGTISATFTASSMRQFNPLTLPTIFDDLNGAFGGFGEDRFGDSQFEYSASPTVSPPAPADVLVLSQAESSTLLSAEFNLTGAPDITSFQSFAHIVLPIDGIGSADLTFVVAPISNPTDNQFAIFNDIIFGPAAVPEASAALFGLALSAAVGVRALYVRRRRRASAV